MFTTPEEVMAATPYDNVTLEQVRMAQYIIESYVGKTEGEIDNGRDKAMLGRATIFQTVYMQDNPDVVFNQVKASMISSGGQMTTFSDNISPFIAPMAALACENLSWKKSRSIDVGRMFQRKGRLSPRERWVTE